MKLHRIILEYFTFTKNERRGLFVLLFLILFFLLANQLIFYFETPGEADPEKFKQLIAMLEENEKNEVLETGELFLFDPNTIDSIQLDSLRLPHRVKQNLLKYRQKGGRLYKAEDIRKIYGMDDSIFDAVYPYVSIKKKQIVKKKNANSFISEKPKVSTVAKETPPKVEFERTFEINSATAKDLKLLSGIGNVLSKRIVKYRELLGGFYTLEQLHEVYGLKPETINNILPYLKIDTATIRKINVNFADVAEIARHPYVSWDQANAILDFRSKNGFIKDVRTIRLNNLMNEEEFKKITSYLKTKN